MAVKITNGTGTNITDANAFYAVESYNLSGFGNGGSLNGTAIVLSATPKRIPLTFTSASATFKGCVLSFLSYAPSSVAPSDNRTITVALRENVSGTWTVRATQALTWFDIHQISRPDIPSTYQYKIRNGYYTVNFDNFSSAITIDNASNKWELSVTVGTGTGDIYMVIGAQTTASYMYAAYTDVTTTFVNGSDTPIIAHPTDISSSTTFEGILSAGDTANPVCGLICSNRVDTSTDNVCLLTILNPPVGGLTFTLKGWLIANGHAGLRVGRETSRIPISNRVIIDSGTPSVGTSTVSSIRTYNNVASTSVSYASRNSLFLYGEEVDTQIAFLTVRANVGTNQLTLDRDVSTVWSNGDRIIIGKQNVQGQGSIVAYTILSISSNVVTLSSNILTNDRLVGAVVANLTSTRYSIYVNTQTRPLLIDSGIAGNLIIKSCYFLNSSIQSLCGYLWWCEDNDNAMIRQEISNCCQETTSSSLSTSFINTHYNNKKGVDFLDLVTFRSIAMYSIYSIYAVQNKMGDVYVDGIYSLAGVTTTFFSATNVTSPVVMKNVYIQNKNSNGFINYTKRGIFTNINLWGFQSGYYAIQMMSVNNKFYNCHIDKCGYAITFANTSTINNKFYNCEFGTEVANVSDIFFVPSGFALNNKFYNCYYTTIDQASYTEFDEGSIVSSINTNNITNRDISYLPTGKIERCGDGLPDSTVKISGAGNFAVKMIPLNEIVEHYWKFKVPTGDISTKTMSFNCWIKIKDVGYYSGVHTNPTLQVNYDDGTLISTIASNSTDWQLLTLTFTPTTSYGEIEITIFGSSDAATDDEKSFYIDSMSVLYPPGVSINLGGLDLWADGMPIGPPIATSISATDIWSVLPSTFSDGSVGAMIVKIDKTGTNNQGLILGL